MNLLVTLDGITTPIGLRDRALIALMVFSFARIGAALAMRVNDVYMQQRRLWIRLHEEGDTLENAAAMANYASTRTTQLYDRRRDEISLDEVERIRL